MLMFHNDWERYDYITVLEQKEGNMNKEYLLKKINDFFKFKFFFIPNTT